MPLPAAVRIVEVGARDGLQNEPQAVGAAERIRFIEALADAGLREVEAGAFVSPKWVPQMAGSDEVLRGLRPRDGVAYTVLVPNLQGYEAARAAGARHIAVFAAASESFSRRNINCSIAESLERFRPVCEAAHADGVSIRGYVSCVLGCPYEGAVAPSAVAAVASELDALGCREISLGDTIGRGTPLAARAMLETVATRVPVERLAVHFHDTWGQALANVYACLELGVATVDASAGGLGGCPYAPGASGNLATEDLLYMLDGLGIGTGVDLDALLAAVDQISKVLGRRPPSRVWSARRPPQEGARSSKQ